MMRPVRKWFVSSQDIFIRVRVLPSTISHDR
jgi:hypothetical protein